MSRHDALRILDDAYKATSPVAVVGMFSGGDDSIAAMRVLELWGKPFRVAHINTGIGVEATRDHVRRVAAVRGWDFSEWRTDPAEYEAMVLGKVRGVAGGFPGPAMHSIYYRRLKERRVYDILRSIKTSRRQAVMLVTGARAAESARRMSTVGEWRKEKSMVWVNPLAHWTTDERGEFIQEEGLPRNPVSKLLHMSGECLCGAMNSKGELAMFRALVPEAMGRIDEIAEKVHAAGYPWEWDERQPGWFARMKRGQSAMPFMPLCVGCEERAQEVEG